MVPVSMFNEIAANNGTVPIVRGNDLKLHKMFGLIKRYFVVYKLFPIVIEFS